LWLWVLAAPVRAEEVSPEGRFSLEIKSCPTVSAQAVRRILGIEIGDLLLGEGDSLSVAHDRLTIRCVGHFARIEAAGPSLATPFEQAVDLEAFPEDAVARALALAGLELLSTMSSAVRTRLSTPPLPAQPPKSPPAASSPPVQPPKSPPAVPSPPVQPQAQPQPPTPPPAAPAAPKPPPQMKQAPPPSRRDTRLGLAGSWRTFLRDRGLSLWGGKLEASTTLGDLWLVTADADVAGARNRVEGVGTVDALSFSSGLSFGARLQSGSWGASVGMGGRLGLIRMTGQSANSTAVSASYGQRPWGGPLAMACASTRLGRFSLMLSAEAGYSFLVFDGLADGKTAALVGGPWIAVGLGGGFHP
jgi:hypothetical protein